MAGFIKSLDDFLLQRKASGKNYAQGSGNITYGTPFVVNSLTFTPKLVIVRVTDGSTLWAEGAYTTYLTDTNLNPYIFITNNHSSASVLNKLSVQSNGFTLTDVAATGTFPVQWVCIGD